MISYLEDFLGLESDYLLNSDFGILLCLILTTILIFAVFKAIFLWFDKLFAVISTTPTKLTPLLYYLIYLRE